MSGYPRGETHHLAKYSSETVERARVMHDEGHKPTAIAMALGVPLHTCKDWIHYRTRASG